MLFVAFFGIQDKEEYIGTYNNIICPSCGRLDRYEIYKSYRYFHLFFIPVYRWDVKFIVRASCCGSVYELDPVIGKEFEKNKSVEIRNEHLRRLSNFLPYKYCSNCRTNVPAEYKYCPYCGKGLGE